MPLDSPRVKSIGIMRGPFRQRLQAILAAVLAIAILAVCLPAAQAFAQGELSTKAKNAILVDVESGAVVYQQAADELVYPASMSKLMTLAVLFKAIKDGKVKLEDEFLMSENAWRTGGAPSGTSAMFVPINTKARDRRVDPGHCRAVGQRCVHRGGRGDGRIGGEVRRDDDGGGTPHRSARSRRSQTRQDCTNDGQKMTARELATLAMFLIREYPEQYKVFGQREFQYRKHKFYNRNPLLSLDMGVDGLKTGHTNEAGYGLVASAVRDGRRLVGVVMGLAERKGPPRRSQEDDRLGLQQLVALQAVRCG